MSNLRLFSALFVLLVASASARAEDDGISSTAVARAHKFFNTTDRAKAIIGMVHYGCAFNSHSYVGHGKVADRSGKTIPGHFTVQFDYKWSKNKGETRLAFFCDSKGNFYEMKVISTNAQFAEPFVWSKVAIKVLGEAILAAMKNELKEDDTKAIRKKVDDVDPKGLLETSLMLQQAFGK